MKRTRFPAMEVVIQRGRLSKQSEAPLITATEMDVDLPAAENNPPVTLKKKVGRPRAKQTNPEVADQVVAGLSKTTSTRSTRARKGPQAELPYQRDLDDESIEEVQTSQRATRSRGTRSAAQSSRKSKEDVSKFAKPPGKASKAARHESPTNHLTDTSGGHTALEIPVTDYGSLFGDEETEDRNDGVQDGVPADDVNGHAPKARDLQSANSASLPLDLQPSFIACQKAVIKNLTKNTLLVQPEISPNSIAIQELADLIDGTVHRAEGNSCLILGPRGSGKSTVSSNVMNFPSIANVYM